ncbi:MAG: pantoate--beta-alanine ligase [Pirellulales bacterium]
MTAPQIIQDLDAMRAAVRHAQAAGETVGIVPTMGALHAGHLSLVAASNQQCNRTVVTIFVNPTQFLPGEDFEQYPRTLEDDLAALAAYEVDFVFTPAAEQMYGPRDEQGDFPATATIDAGPIATEYEGRFRPGHFTGVATVVMKLFQIAPADVAFFGQKDYQQTRVIQQMCADLNVPIEVVVCPTLRDPDGLAMSSRNRYLSADQRRSALTLYQSLDWARQRIEQGEHDPAALIEGMRRPFDRIEEARIDYIAIADPNTLQAVGRIEGEVVLLVAVRIGQTRLIDNLLVARR